jgi:hypothetical protein
MTDKCNTTKHRKLMAKCRANRKERHAFQSARQRQWDIDQALRRKKAIERKEWERLNDPRRPYVQQLVNILYRRVYKNPLVEMRDIFKVMGGNMPIGHRDFLTGIPGFPDLEDIFGGGK